MGETEAWRSRLTPAMIRRYAEDGVLFIPRLLDAEWLDLAEQGIKRSHLSPGPYSKIMNPESAGAWFTDFCNYPLIPEFQYLLAQSPIADVMQYVLDTPQLWLLYEQIFVKAGGDNERTPWHQDLTYWVADGPKLGSMWITIDRIAKEHCLEIVPGSHRGVLYGGARLSSTDESVLGLSYPSLPELPDIDANRSAWNIVSWDIEPGDVIILHPAVLHGGGSTGRAGQRRTVSFRFFGEDTVMTDRFEGQKQSPSPRFPGLSRMLRSGDPLRDPRFPQIRPMPAVATPQRD